jgi:hypothetical protein
MIAPKQFIRVFLQVAVVGITILLVGALADWVRRPNEHPGGPRPAREAPTQTDPERRLVPPWYLARYRADVTPLFAYNQFLSSVFALGFFFYPAWGLAFTLLQYKEFVGRGGRGFRAFLQARDWLAREIFFGYSLGAWTLVLFAGVFLAIFLDFFIALFTPDGYYIPADFIITFLFVCSHLSFAWILGTELNQGMRSGQRSASTVGGARIPTAASLRFRNVLWAIGRAAAVGLAAAFGKEVGGWMGALVGFVITSGVAAYFGFPFPAHQQATEDGLGSGH